MLIYEIFKLWGHSSGTNH